MELGWGIGIRKKNVESEGDTVKYQRDKLYNILGKDLVDLFKQCKVIVAGGAITSIFCSHDIVDIDVYVRDEESLATLIAELYTGFHVMCYTSKATLFVKGDAQVQVIHIGYFDSAESVFVNFDFTVCMGAYDFATESFVLHSQFLLHNSQRILEFNHETKFPLMSALRVQKYKDKGYKVSKAEFLKILLACMDLQVTSYAQLKEHLGGMYGLNMDKLFDETKEFSLVSAIEQLSNLYLSDDYYKEPTKLSFDNADDIIDNIIKTPKKYFESNGAKYIVRANGKAKKVTEVPENATKITAKEYFERHKLIKYVREVNGRYFSFWDKSFEYVTGETVVAENYVGLFCGTDESSLQYQGCEGSTLIELKLVDDNDVVAIGGSMVQLRKALVCPGLPQFYTGECL